MFANISVTDVLTFIASLTALYVAVGNRRKALADANQSDSGAVKTFADTAITMGDKAEDYFARLTKLREEFDLYKDEKEEQSRQRTRAINKLQNTLAQREEELRHLQTLLKLRDDRLEDVEVATMQVGEKVVSVAEELKVISTKITAISPEQINKGSK